MVNESDLKDNPNDSALALEFIKERQAQGVPDWQINGVIGDKTNVFIREYKGRAWGNMDKAGVERTAGLTRTEQIARGEVQQHRSPQSQMRQYPQSAYYPSYDGPRPGPGDPLGVGAGMTATPGYVDRNKAKSVHYPAAWGGGEYQVKQQEAVNRGYTGYMKTPYGGGMGDQLKPEAAMAIGFEALFTRNAREQGKTNPVLAETTLEVGGERRVIASRQATSPSNTPGITEYVTAPQQAGEPVKPVGERDIIGENRPDQSIAYGGTIDRSTVEEFYRRQREETERGNYSGNAPERQTIVTYERWQDSQNQMSMAPIMSENLFDMGNGQILDVYQGAITPTTGPPIGEPEWGSMGSRGELAQTTWLGGFIGAVTGGPVGAAVGAGLSIPAYFAGKIAKQGTTTAYDLGVAATDYGISLFPPMTQGIVRKGVSDTVAGIPISRGMVGAVAEVGGFMYSYAGLGKALAPAAYKAVYGEAKYSFGGKMAQTDVAGVRLGSYKGAITEPPRYGSYTMLRGFRSPEGKLQSPIKFNPSGTETFQARFVVSLEDTEGRLGARNVKNILNLKPEPNMKADYILQKDSMLRPGHGMETGTRQQLPLQYSSEVEIRKFPANAPGQTVARSRETLYYDVAGGKSIQVKGKSLVFKDVPNQRIGVDSPRPSGPGLSINQPYLRQSYGSPIGYGSQTTERLLPNRWRKPMVDIVGQEGKPTILKSTSRQGRMVTTFRKDTIPLSKGFAKPSPAKVNSLPFTEESSSSGGQQLMQVLKATTKDAQFAGASETTVRQAVQESSRSMWTLNPLYATGVGVEAVSMSMRQMPGSLRGWGGARLAFLPGQSGGRRLVSMPGLSQQSLPTSGKLAPYSVAQSSRVFQAQTPIQRTLPKQGRIPKQSQRQITGQLPAQTSIPGQATMPGPIPRMPMYPVGGRMIPVGGVVAGLVGVGKRRFGKLWTRSYVAGSREILGNWGKTGRKHGKKRGRKR